MKSSFRLAGALTCVACALGVPIVQSDPAHPWPMFRHDLNHTGRSQYDTSKNNGQEKWTFKGKNGITSSAAIGSDGTIYVSGYESGMYAL